MICQIHMKGLLYLVFMLYSTGNLFLVQTKKAAYHRFFLIVSNKASVAFTSNEADLPASIALIAHGSASLYLLTFVSNAA